jgi:Uncharacterized protein conserved in bacteria
MNVLLDTHAFLWWVMDDPRLSNTVRALLADISTVPFISAACGWEIATKVQIGRLSLTSAPPEFVLHHCKINGIRFLPISVEHGSNVSFLPLIHKDPFDRILIAQAQLENMPLVTTDAAISKYGVPVIW